MKKLLVLIFITGLLLLIVLINFDFFTSIIPGWHTTIYPLWAIMTTILLALIFTILIIKMLRLFLTKRKTNQ